MIKEQLIVFIKALAMGAVNTIPGVSGGTIAMITGVFERIVNSLKSFDLSALKMLLKGKLREFAQMNTEFVIAFGLCILGICTIYLIEFLAKKFLKYEEIIE